jgi:thymidylate synthase ThyX
MTITAQIIADSISPAGIRLTTFQLRYPRFIHAELMTHRMFSRNASSSRAIPVARMIEDLRRDPAMPVYWGSNKPGMQAGAELEGTDLQDAKNYWIDGMNLAIGEAEKLVSLGLHKQIANRILEPWAHINVVLTATSFANFFALRSHPDAQPEIKMLSDLMQEEMNFCDPHRCREDEWHLPYILDSDWLALKVFAKTNRITRDEPSYKELAQLALRVSVARCARVSYKTHDGRETSVEEDMALADKLITATPLHASPAEHQACPDEGIQHGFDISWMNPNLHGNLTGWKQYRKMLPSEFVAG